jgi:integrase
MKPLHKGVTQQADLDGLAKEPEVPALPTHLVKVGSVYKFRARIPQDLLKYYRPKKEITESLGTKSLTDARRLLPAIQLKFQMEWADLRAATTSNYTELTLNDATIQYLTTFFEHESLAGDERTRLGGNYTLEEIQDYREQLADTIAYLRDAVAVGNVDIIKPALDQYLDLKRVKVTGSEDDYRKLALAYMRGAIKTNSALLARMNGDAVPTPEVGDHPEVSPQATSRSTSTQAKSKGITLYSLFEYWRDAVKGRPRRTIDDFERCVREVDAVTGNKPANELTKADVIQYRDALSAKGKHYSTVEKDLSFLKTMLRYAYESEKLDRNPSEGVKVAKPKVSKNPKRALTGSDLSLLLGSSIYTAQERPLGGGRDASAWIPLLGLYTGARLEELCQLRVPDIQEESGIHYLDIIDLDDDDEDIHTSVKTDESRRKVPLHRELIRAGFLTYVEYVKEQGHDWLFPHLNPDQYDRRGGNWSKWWTLWRRKLGVGGRQRCFHAFRHTFKTACRRPDIAEEHHDAITGHSGGSVGREYGYVPLETKAGVMAKVRYSGVQFDWVWQPSTEGWAKHPLRTSKPPKPASATKPRKTKPKSPASSKSKVQAGS